MRRSTAWIIIGIAWATLTLLDLLQPSGLVISAVFIAVVVFAFSRLAPREALIIAGLCSVSALGAVYATRHREAFLEESVERALIVGAIWLSAFLMYRRGLAEHSLEESRAQQQAILDCAADGILTVDARGVIRSVNPAGHRILGYTEGQLAGEPLNTIIPHQYRQSHSEAMSAYAEGRIDISHLIGVTREVEALKRDGTVIPVEVNVTVAKTAQTKLFSAVMRDITARRETERQLREQQRTLSTLLSNLPGMAYRCKLDSSWTMLFVSQGALELTGYEPFELEHNRAMSYGKLIYPADRDRVAELVTAAVAARQTYDLTYRIVQRSGEIRWVMEKGAAVRGHDGALTCLEGFITDITREKRVEEALRESEARFRTIADSTPIMIWASGIDRQITFANKRILEFTGLAIDELLGDSWLAHVHPDDVKRVAEYYTLMFDSWQSFEMEYRLRRCDGEYRWVLIAGVPRHAPDGDFMGYIGSGIDIHARKQAELALLESEGRFREIADSSPAMMWLTDSKGMATFVNKTWLDFTGRRIDQELGIGWLESIHPEDQARVGSSFIEAFSRKNIWNHEYRVRRHDGVYRWIIDRGAPYYTPHGDFAGYCGSCFDFTDRREATEALRESEERFRAVANQAPAIIWVAAPDGAFTFINQTWYDLTGQTLESSLGHGWTNMIHPDDREAALASTARGFESRSRYENAFRVRAKDGSWRRLLNYGVPRFGEDGELLGYTGSAIDVTDRDRLDQIISHVATGVSASTDADFLRSLSAQLADALGADMVSIGEVHPDDASRMRTVAFLQDREIQSDLEYTLQGTPCAVALSEGWFACREQVQSLFPTDQFLIDNCLEGYIGHALRDSKGVNQGVIWVLFRRAVPDLQLGLSLLRIFAVRAAAELERRRAMETLRSSEEQFRLSVKASEAIAFRQDVNLRYTWMFNAANVSDEDVIGHTDHEIFPAEQADILADIKRSVLNSGVGARTEVELSLNGTPRLYDLIVEPIVNSFGEISEITCVASDITERRRMVETLRESEQRYRRLFEHAPIALCEYDLSGVKSKLSSLEGRGAHDVISFYRDNPEECVRLFASMPNASFNRQALSLFGVESENQLRDALRAVATDTLVAAVIRFIGALLSGCTSFEDEIELQTVSGIRRHIVTRSMLAPGHEHDWSRVVTSMVDVTSQRRAEDALRMSESRYRQMFEESPMAKLEVDLSHVKVLLDTELGTRDIPLTDALSRRPELLERCMTLMRFTSANATALRVFHAASADELCASIPALFTESTCAVFGDLLDRLWKGETACETETKFRTLNGETRHGQVHCVLTTDTVDDWSRVLVAILDVTENRQAAEELGRAKRLETAGRLAGQIAHDFNNLLGPLVAYPEILQAKFPAEGRAHEMLSDMQSAALQIAEINQELLTLSRRGHYNTEPLDLNALVRSAVRTVEIPPTVAVDLKASPGDLKIRGGSAQLMRVLVNLIRNSIEAMDDVGRLTIVTENIYLDEPLHNYATVSRGEYARVAITDTGCGIPSEALEHIFEPFFTTKKADKKRGTGLGLAVVHSVIEDHEGYIDVTSTPGVGTTFMLYFPLFRGELASSKTTDTIREGHGELVVVVDDDPLQRRIAQTALERIGYEVVVLESGEDAVRYLKHNPADIVLLDMVMGGIDGAETLRQIREIHPRQTALILTGYSTSARVQAALALGECGVLAKPIQVSTLTSAIYQALTHGRSAGTPRRVSTK